MSNPANGALRWADGRLAACRKDARAGLGRQEMVSQSEVTNLAKEKAGGGGIRSRKNGTANNLNGYIRATGRPTSIAILNLTTPLDYLSTGRLIGLWQPKILAD